MPRLTRRDRLGLPGLVHRTEPLAPGEAHVDPADPRARPLPGDGWLTWRIRAFTFVAPVMAVVAVVIAVDEGVWHPLLAAVLWLVSGAASWHALQRYARSGRAPRDSLRTSGWMLVALVLLFGGIPFVVP